MNNLLNKKRSDVIDSIIVFFLFALVIIFESIKTLTGLFRYGVLKKEILTTKSNLGFDFKIIIK